jgi:gamma-glutamyl-gamma-aminobutyrate hydrolase PuuD
MSHDYLFDTYRYLRQRLDDIQPRLTGGDADPAARSYAAGQLEALCDLERFLKDRYEMKLPRRLRNQRTPLEGICTKTN